MWIATKPEAEGYVARAARSTDELIISPQQGILQRSPVTTLCAKLLATIIMAGTGCTFALLTAVHGVDTSSGYFLLATILLAIGLFSSTYDIAINELKRNARFVLMAVTFGVLLKAGLIAGVMYFIFYRDPAYLVLGVAMAQIDPLSVAVTRQTSQLSQRAKSILSAWASLDDPVTAILAIYLSSVALSMRTAYSARPDGNSVSMGLSDFVANLFGNVLIVLGAALMWWLLHQAVKITKRGITDEVDPSSTSLRIIGAVALTFIAAIAVDNFWMLGLALVGLFFRPGLGKILSYATFIACAVATFLLGVVLADGVNLIPGIVLGTATFGSQVVVGALMTRRMSRGDSLRLALGQQSGITAVILALLLETMFPGTVAIVAPAILVINALHLVSNTILDRREKCTTQSETTDEGKNSRIASRISTPGHSN